MCAVRPNPTGVRPAALGRLRDWCAAFRAGRCVAASPTSHPRGSGVTGLPLVCSGLWGCTDGRLELRKRYLEVFLVVLIEESWRLRFYIIQGCCCALAPALTLLGGVICLPCNCWRVWHPFDFPDSLGTELWVVECCEDRFGGATLSGT
ncbi:hypothetical protein NDU88_001390 [Pleurodeles waltl]|uniref:Uncharacterized protein n=1 Tax=Pleurodeles waltl TaxID=8319 RepID=A0AAV7VWR3_PLEWA|nr:hypothetical protein NDU88_001390 [Pleurodeles waltl]